MKLNLIKNINTSVILNLDKIYLEKDQYLKKLNGEFDIKNNKLILAKADEVLENGNKFSYSLEKQTKMKKLRIYL